MDEDKLAGVLLGTAIGDALGLPAENLSPRRIARLFGRIDRFRFLGRTGYVSDDTEQSAFVGHALLAHHDDPAAFARDFARRLVGWFWRLPFGAGFATVRACLKLMAGVSPARSGVVSAGNGASMRAALVGVYFADDAPRRRSFGTALAQITHRDPRAVEGALFVAEVAAALARGEPAGDAVRAARPLVTAADLGARLDEAVAFAGAGANTLPVAQKLGNTGFVVHTVPFAAFLLLRYGADPRAAVEEAANAGGDSDTIGAIVGALVGAMAGARGLPADLVADLEDGPLGRTHLVALAHALANPGEGAPRYSAARLLVRNAALLFVVFGHVARRLMPF